MDAVTTDTPIIPLGTSDERRLKVQRLFSQRGTWLRCTDRKGVQWLGMPSESSPGLYHMANADRCSCPSFRFSGLSRDRVGFEGLHEPCIHVMAVRMMIARAQANGWSE